MNRYAIPATAGLILAAALIVPQLVQDSPQKQGRLEWDYPIQDSNLVFVLMTTTDLVHWSHLLTTNRGPVPIILNEPKRFYACYASNEWTGQTSLP